MLNHYTIHVSAGTLADPKLDELMSLLGFKEVPARDSFEHGWSVRWWRPYGIGAIPLLHLVESDDGEEDIMALGHFCINHTGKSLYGLLRASQWCVRDSGSGRIWLQFHNIRIEVRP